jgi:hypothetical protein
MSRVLSFLTALSLCSAGLQAQAFSVSVRDSAGTPIEQVGLLLFDHKDKHIATARTGREGFAHMPRADTGTFRLHARRFGFRPRYTEFIHIGPTDTIAVQITLERVATILDPIVVRSERDSVRNDWNPFGINLRATGGHIITPTEIEYAILGARDMADVLARRGLPGIVIDHYRRCPRSIRGGGCLPFAIDGQVYREGASLQDVVVPEMVDYVIVLRGAEVGVRYGAIGGNGIVLIATKNADWWRRR